MRKTSGSVPAHRTGRVVDQRTGLAVAEPRPAGAGLRPPAPRKSSVAEVLGHASSWRSPRGVAAGAGASGTDGTQRPAGRHSARVHQSSATIRLVDRDVSRGSRAPWGGTSEVASGRRSPHPSEKYRAPGSGAGLSGLRSKRLRLKQRRPAAVRWIMECDRAFHMAASRTATSSKKAGPPQL